MLKNLISRRQNSMFCHGRNSEHQVCRYQLKKKGQIFGTTPYLYIYRDTLFPIHTSLCVYIPVTRATSLYIGVKFRICRSYPRIHISIEELLASEKIDTQGPSKSEPANRPRKLNPTHVRQNVVMNNPPKEHCPV